MSPETYRNQEIKQIQSDIRKDFYEHNGYRLEIKRFQVGSPLKAEVEGKAEAKASEDADPLELYLHSLASARLRRRPSRWTADPVCLRTGSRNLEFRVTGRSLQRLGSR